MDLLGSFLRHTPSFKGKRRLAWRWMASRDTSAKRTTALPGGFRVACDLSVPYEAMVWLGLEEDRDLGVARQLLSAGQTFVDCGANIGLWSLMASSVVGKTGHVFAFEPNPATSRRLSANVRENAIGNLTVANAAVGAHSGTAHFHCDASHNVSSMVSESGPDTIDVPVVTLDDYLGEREVHGIKIDVEGYEFEVLKGAHRIIGRPETWLCVEFNSLTSRINRLGEWDVHRLLKGLGYSAWLMSDALRAAHICPLPDSWETNSYCNLYYRRPGTLTA